MRILFLVAFWVLIVIDLSWATPSCPPGQTWNDCSGPQFGPGGCVPGCVGEPSVPPSPDLSGPGELCLPEGCQPVVYSWLGTMVVAGSRLPNGYSVLGWAGPCLDSYQQCPDIFNQAFTDLRLNALRANRAQRYE